jgi:hypothetical protein
LFDRFDEKGRKQADMAKEARASRYEKEKRQDNGARDQAQDGETMISVHPSPPKNSFLSNHRSVVTFHFPYVATIFLLTSP